MQICNVKKSLLLIASSVLLTSFLTSQGVTMPAKPEIPSMPTISLDGTFYTPGLPAQLGTKKKVNKKTDETEKKESILTDGTTATDIFSSLMGSSSTLTASDISSLYDSGLFSNVSSLESANSLSSYATSSTTNILLQQVLNSLNDLKAEQKKATAAEKEVLENTKTDSENFKNREPNILRFKINGYDITDSLTTVFFSEPEADGSFLLTADRKYYANQRTLSETFYMLFKTVSSKGSTVSYKIQPTIVQDQKNENSFVYKMMEQKNLTAEKTGNLVVLHFNGDNLTADMLLDIDKR